MSDLVRFIGGIVSEIGNFNARKFLQDKLVTQLRDVSVARDRFVEICKAEKQKHHHDCLLNCFVVDHVSYHFRDRTQSVRICLAVV